MKENKCPRCSSLLEDDSTFCSECGCKIEEEVATPIAERTFIPQTEKKGKGSLTKVIGILLLIAMLGGVGYLFKNSIKPSSEKSSVITSTKSTESKETQKPEKENATALRTDAPIDFSKLVTKPNGFSINSGNASVFNSIKKTDNKIEDIAGNWSGKAYFLGFMTEYDKSKVDEKATENGIAFIESPEQVKDIIASVSNISISVTTLGAGDKLSLKLTEGGDSTMGSLLNYLDIFKVWDFNSKAITYKGAINEDKSTSNIIGYGIKGKNNESKDVLVILITVDNETLINTDTGTKGKTLEQIELVLSKK
jgi:flagellar basal body-associated protein FliL